MSAHSLVLSLLQILTDVPHYHRDAVSQQLRPEVVEKLLDIFKVPVSKQLVSQTSCTCKARHCTHDPRPVLHHCLPATSAHEHLACLQQNQPQASVATHSGCCS